jgi:hypothetical protein
VRVRNVVSTTTGLTLHLSFIQGGSVSVEEQKSFFCRDFEILSSAEGRSGTKRWLPYHSKTHINAINAGPLILSRCPSCINKERTPIAVHSVGEAVSPIPHKQQHHLVREATFDHSSSGDLQTAFFLSGYCGFERSSSTPKTAETIENAVATFLVMGFACLVGMILNIRRISRYNRDIYPRLHWDWSTLISAGVVGVFALSACNRSARDAGQLHISIGRRDQTHKGSSGPVTAQAGDEPFEPLSPKHILG